MHFTGMPQSPFMADTMDALGVYASPRQNDNKKQPISTFMLIDLDGVHVNPDLIAVVRAAGDDQTVIFTAGQSATDGGHLIDMPIEDVLDAIRCARYTVAMQDLEEAERSVVDVERK